MTMKTVPDKKRRLPKQCTRSPVPNCARELRDGVNYASKYGIDYITESLLSVIRMHVSQRGFFSWNFGLVVIICKASYLQELVVIALIGLGLYAFCVFRR